MAVKLVIVGGVAGGATAAARARRLDEEAEIIVFACSAFKCRIVLWLKKMLAIAAKPFNMCMPNM